MKTRSCSGPARRQKIRTSIQVIAVSMYKNGKMSIQDIADILGCTRQTVSEWITRYGTEGLAGLDDRSRSGRPPKMMPVRNF